MPKKSREIDWTGVEDELAMLFDEVAQSREDYASLEHCLWFLFNSKIVAYNTSLGLLKKEIISHKEEFAKYEVAGKPLGHKAMRNIIDVLAELEAAYQPYFLKEDLYLKKIETAGQLRDHLFQLRQSFRNLPRRWQDFKQREETSGRELRPAPKKSIRFEEP